MELTGKKILVTGAQGMLGTDLCAALEQGQVSLVRTDCIASGDGGGETALLDITDREAVSEALAAFRPEWIVNCAAYTNVDGAETDRDAAFAVNAQGPENLARAAFENGVKLLHVSTDYVYGGEREGEDSRRRRPFKETDGASPCGVYGQSKYAGDQAVIEILPDSHLIVRTSWLHGVHGPNFIHTILRLAEEKEEIRVVDDQIGSPTWTVWLAQTLIELMGRDARGVYNASSRGDISWFEFAREIVAQAGTALKVGTQTTEELNRPAPRPAYSTLDTSKLEMLLGVVSPDWREDLRGHLLALGVVKEEQCLN